MIFQCYDFRWIDEKSSEIQANNGQKFAKRVLKTGDDLSIEIIDEVRCAGSYRDGIWKPCPNQVTGRKKCEACRSREGNFIFTMFDGFDMSIFSPEDLKLLEGDHYVYLAFFDDGVIKIGVSKKDRKSLRQLEQGAHFSLFIAQTSDGIKARQIETLFRKDGIIDKLKSSEKAEFLYPDINPEEAKKQLLETFENHKNCLDSYEALRRFLIEPEFCDWGPFFGKAEIKSSLKPLETISFNVPGDWISGKIMGIKGPFITLDVGDHLMAFCARDLSGYDADFSPKKTGFFRKNSIQNKLF